MPRITLVEPQKKNPQRFNIYIDGDFAFGADEDLVVDQRLIVGKEISKENLEKLYYEAEVGKLIEKVYGLLNRRGRSEKEVRDYLRNLSFKRKAKGGDEVSLESIDRTINKLKQRGLLNDTEFANNWVEARSNKKGPRAMQAELYKKGISKELMVEAMGSQFTTENQAKTAQSLLEKKLNNWSRFTNLEKRKKALEFLMRRGFDYALSRSVVDNLVKKEYDNEEENEDFSE